MHLETKKKRVRDYTGHEHQGAGILDAILLQIHFGDTAGSIPDHCNKVNMDGNKGSQMNFSVFQYI